MDNDTKLIQARLDALEAILHNVVKRDEETLEEIRIMLRREYTIAQKNAVPPAPTGTFQTAGQIHPKPTRDHDAEQARVRVYEQLCRRFGATS